MTQRVTEFVTPKIIRAQKQLIKDFTQHPVTKEINSGPLASNSSGLLGGYGNLFSFFGFEYSSDPTGPIYDILQRQIDVSAVRKGVQGRFEIYLQNAPSKEEIFNVTHFDWLAGRSWVDGVEKGVSGLGQYMYSEEGFKGSNLRSTTGIQSKAKIVSSKFQNVSYISQMLNDFRERIRR